MERVVEPINWTANLTWDLAVDAFAWSRRVAGCSDETLKWHEVTLRLFRRCHDELNLNCPSPQTCPPEHLRLFLFWLQRRGIKLVSQQTYYRSLRAFFRFLVREGLRDDVPTEKVPMPKPEQPLPRTVTEDHFLKAIATFNPAKFCDLRNLALFVLLYDTGARLGEILNLKVGSVDLKNRQAVVKGKGRKERVIVFGLKAAGLLQKWLMVRALRLGVPSDDDYLFCFANGSPLNRSYVGKIWRKAQRKAGLTPLPVHGLRHGFARLWLLRGGDALSLQILLGHTTSDMTRRYVTLWGQDLKKLHSQVSPIDRLHLPKGCGLH